ncbi:MAG TPA: primosomal protein N' [Actinomycetota bacterium]|nr:primosomal protein N' [Actinomycetota bacterium]
MSSAGSAPDGPAPNPRETDPALIASVVPLVPAWRLDRTFDYLVPPDKPVEVGYLVRVELGHRTVRGIVTRVVSGPPTRPLDPIKAVVVDRSLLPPPMGGLMDWIALRYGATLGATLKAVVPARVRVAVAPTPRLDGVDATPELATLDGGAGLVEALTRNEPGLWCVRPAGTSDTGLLASEIVGSVFAAGKSALVAVPEVRFGSHIFAALEKRWPEASRLDSGAEDRERASGWLALAAGHPLGIGGRSTLFAPACDVGALVVDDEHHSSFKEDRSPRYDARVVAIERARRSDAVCVLMSSTPRLETAWRVRTGRAKLVEPTRAAERAARPIVEIVGMPADRALSQELHARIGEKLRAGERVALVAPRRGYSRTVWCASCRHSVRCLRCDAAMGWMRGGRIECPRCSASDAAPDRCPRCKEADLRHIGAGVERLEEQLSASFPRTKVVRLDPDDPNATSLEAAGSGIYLTTWFGTKDTLRPPASLVALLDAGPFLRRPDFRAAEHAYDALAELAHWAGPAASGGHLLIQTDEPGHHAVQAVARADYWFFADKELAAREELGYPPFTELIKLVASGPRAAEVMDRAVSVARTEHARVLGPIEVKVGPRREAALQALLKCDDAILVAVGLRGILADTPAGTRLAIDTDPK